MLSDTVIMGVFAIQSGAIGYLYRRVSLLERAANRATKERAELIVAHGKELTDLRLDNASLEDDLEHVTRERNQLHWLYVWYMKAYRGLEGTENPPPFDTCDAKPEPRPRRTPAEGGQA